MPPLVSIIIPVYNPGVHLEPTLRSAIAQTWRNLEIIVVDDGSTDDSLTVARRFESDRFLVLTQKNRGSCAARNTGARTARGDYLQFLDHDDLLAPEKIARQMEHTHSAISPRTLLMGEVIRFFNSADGVRHEISANEDYHPAWAGTHPEFAELLAVDWLVRWWTRRMETTPLAWLIPRELMAAAGPWEERFLSRLDDFEFITRLLLAADRVVVTPGARSYFRTLVAGSMSSAAQNRSRHALEGQLLALNLCCDHLLAVEDAPRTRAAAAGLLMDYAYSAYPSHAVPALVAETRARALCAPLPPCPGGRFTQKLVPIVGWRLAKRLQHLAITCGYSRR